VRRHEEHSKGHGRRERRAIETSTWLNEYLSEGWPGVAQVFRLTRERAAKGGKTAEVVYGFTSLGRVGACAEDLLALSRGHWGVENGLHYTRDETLREDRCRVRRGNAPRALATLRGLAIHLLRADGRDNVAAATREMAACPERALELLLDLDPISE
jgi:predicted transposase YbfD/YdcC